MLASGPVVGVLAGWAFGGRLSRLSDLRVRLWGVLAMAVAIRLLAGVAGDFAPSLYVMAFVGIVVVALGNARLAGMPLLALGSLLNLLVVAANGGMPVDQGALTAAGAQMPSDRLHLPLTDGTVLSILADRIPLSPFRSVYSLGDVLLTVGGFWIPFAAMRRQ